jgi:hypothetical protein
MTLIRRNSYLILWLLWLGMLDYALITGKAGTGWAWGILGTASILLLYWLISKPGKGAALSPEEFQNLLGKGQPVVVWLFSRY